MISTLALLRQTRWALDVLAISNGCRSWCMPDEELVARQYFWHMCQLREIKQLYFEWPDPRRDSRDLNDDRGDRPRRYEARFYHAQREYRRVVDRYQASPALCKEVVRQILNEMVSRPRDALERKRREDVRLSQTRFEELLRMRNDPQVRIQVDTSAQPLSWERGQS